MDCLGDKGFCYESLERCRPTFFRQRDDCGALCHLSLSWDRWRRRSSVVVVRRRWRRCPLRRRRRRRLWRRRSFCFTERRSPCTAPLSTTTASICRWPTAVDSRTLDDSSIWHSGTKFVLTHTHCASLYHQRRRYINSPTFIGVTAFRGCNIIMFDLSRILRVRTTVSRLTLRLNSPVVAIIH